MLEDTKFIPYLYNRYMLTSVLALFAGTAGQIGSNLIAGKLLGVSALSIIRLMNPLYYCFATIGNLIGTGGAVVCADLVGKREYERCGQIIFIAYTAVLTLSAVVAALCVCNMDALLTFSGVSGAIRAEAGVYASITALSGFSVAGVYLTFNFLRLEGKTTGAIMLFSVTSAANILLSLLFISTLRFGAAGAAAAAAISSATAVIWGLFLLRGGSLSLCRVPFRVIPAQLISVVNAGVPGGIENLCILLAGLFFNALLLGVSGVTALAIYGVVGSLNTFAVSVIAGVGGSVSPMIGIFKAENDTVSIRQTLRAALKCGAVSAGLMTLFCLLLGRVVAAQFGVEQADFAIRAYSLSFPPAMINTLLIALHQSNNRPVLAGTLTFLRVLLFPVAAALLLTGLWKASGIWYGFLTAEILTLFAAAAFHCLLSKDKPSVSGWTLIDEEAEINGRSMSFSAGSSTGSVMECVHQIKDFCAHNRLTAKQSMLISLSLEEMLISICRHSLAGFPDERISIRLLSLSGSVVLRIRYKGIKFNPIAYFRLRESALSVDSAREDWIGIKMIADAADAVDYRNTFGVNNLTILL